MKKNSTGLLIVGEAEARERDRAEQREWSRAEDRYRVHCEAHGQSPAEQREWHRVWFARGWVGASFPLPPDALAADAVFFARMQRAAWVAREQHRVVRAPRRERRVRAARERSAA